MAIYKLFAEVKYCISQTTQQVTKRIVIIYIRICEVLLRM